MMERKYGVLWFRTQADRPPALRLATSLSCYPGSVALPSASEPAPQASQVVLVLGKPGHLYSLLFSAQEPLEMPRSRHMVTA